MVPEANSSPHLHRALENGRSPRELLNDFDKLSHVVVPQKQLWIKTRRRNPNGRIKKMKVASFSTPVLHIFYIEKREKKHT